MGILTPQDVVKKNNAGGLAGTMSGGNKPPANQPTFGSQIQSTANNMAKTVNNAPGAVPPGPATGTLPPTMGTSGTVNPDNFNPVGDILGAGGEMIGNTVEDLIYPNPFDNPNYQDNMTDTIVGGPAPTWDANNMDAAAWEEIRKGLADYDASVPVPHQTGDTGAAGGMYDAAGNWVPIATPPTYGVDDVTGIKLAGDLAKVGAGGGITDALGDTSASIFGTDSPYGTRETNAMDAIANRQDLTPEDRMREILNMRDTMGGSYDENGQWVAGSDPLGEGVRAALLAAASGDFSAAGAEKYAAQKALIEEAGREGLEQMQTSLGGNYSLWGSERLDSERQFQENQAREERAVMADIMKQEFDTATKFVLEDEGLKNAALKIAADVAGQTDDASIASSNTMTNYLSNVSSQFNDQTQMKLTESREKFDREQANIQNELSNRQMLLSEAQGNQQAFLTQQKNELDGLIADKTAQLTATGMSMEEAMADANRDVDVQALIAANKQQNSDREMELLNMQTDVEKWTSDFSLSQDKQNTETFAIVQDVFDKIFDNMFPEGVYGGYTPDLNFLETILGGGGGLTTNYNL